MSFEENPMKRSTRAALLALGALAFAAAAAADVAPDAAAGRDKSRMCAGCHGIPDYRIAYPQVYSVPRLGGQEPGYIGKELQSYRSGARKHITMEGMAAQLSDQDIADIAAYYALAQPQSHGDIDISGRKKAEEACAACHGPEGGKPTFPGAPVLAGQQYDYLVHELDAFRDGTRTGPMQGIAKSLSADEMRALSRYYSTLPGLRDKY
jgi:cytochrome c553